MRRVAPFDPTQVSGCSIWLDASDLTTITYSSGSNISSWIDKSGNANHATQPTGSNQPTYGSANGQNYVFFNGGQALITPVTSQPTQETLFFVFKKTVADPTYVNTTIFGTTKSQGRDMFIWGDTTTPVTAIAYDAYENALGSVSANLTFGVTHVGAGTYASGVTTIFADGTGYTPVSVAFSGGGTTMIGASYLHGTAPTLFAPLTGYVYEIVIYNSSLSVAQRQNVEGYLAQKWGLKDRLPGGHPGITTTIYPTPRTLSMTPRQYPASYNPTTVAGCCLWLDGADSTSTSAITSGTWYDKSSFASNATAYAGGSSFSMGSINGLSAVTFSSAANAFVANTTLSTSGFSIFFVVRITSLSGNGTRFVMSGEGYGLQIYALSASFPFQLGTYVYSFFPSNNSSISQNAIFIYSVTIGPSLYYQWINGVANSSSGSGNLSLSSIYIGNVNGPTDSTLAFVGQMGEFLVYNSSLTDPQRQTIEGYLASKWSLQGSLPSDHPYKSASPNITNPYNVTRQALPSALFPTPKTNTGPIPLYPSYTNTNGLVSFFLFDNTIADVRNTIILAQTGSISYVTGRRNQALSLTNTSGVAPTNYLTSTYSFPSTFTVSMWFQSPNTSVATMVFCAANTISLVTGSISIYYTGGNLYCAYSDIVNNATAYVISGNTWYHVLLTYNSGSTTLYVNGSQSGNTITGTNSKNGFTLGGGRDTLTQYPFTGYIDDFRIYNRVLSGSEITAIYNGTG
jgi:Concanavalin A-like lectin/glucanases superfamily